MANFPTSLPQVGTASSSATLAAAGHTSLHNTLSDEARAIATKIGTGSSTASAGTVLRGTGGGTSAWGAVAAGTDITGVLGVGNGGTGVQTSSGTGAVLLGTAPTISNPTVSGGSWSGSPTITTPTIASFTNAQHDHSNATGGGVLNTSVLNNPYKFSVYRAAALTPGSADIIWDTKLYDTGSNFDTTTGRFTAPISGTYQFNSTISMIFTAANVGMCASLAVNGTIKRSGTRQVVMYAGTYSAACVVHCSIQLSAGDYVTIVESGASSKPLDVGQGPSGFDGYLISKT